MRSNVATSFHILTPLLAFERVYRRTGFIRKTCIVQNATDEPLELLIRYGFREHSWFQIYADDGSAFESQESERLTAGPGQTRLRVLMNTDSSNFPYDRFRGRVYFEEAGAQSGETGGASQWLEISFEEIDELRNFQGYAAIDLGTSNSTAAVYHLEYDAVTGAPWCPELEDDEVEVPSAVLVRDLGHFRNLLEGSCVVGRAALREYAENPLQDPRCLQLGTKRLVGTDRILTADSHGAGGFVDPLNVLYMLARSIRERVQSHDGIRACIRKLIVTFPPTWDYKQIDRWKEIFRRLRFSDADLDLSLDEASAAGLFFIYRWIKDEDPRNRLLQDLLHSAEEIRENGVHVGDRYLLNLLSFDFGGGTIDLAVIRVHLTVLSDIIRMRITLQGSDSLNYGGDQVTLAVFRVLKRRIAMGLSDPERLLGRDEDKARTRAAAEEASVESGLFLLPTQPLHRRLRVAGSAEAGMEVIRERWTELEQKIADERLPPELEDAVDAVFSTRFWKSLEEPISPLAKTNFGWLWERAESLKRELFRQANRRERGIGLRERPVDDIRGGVRLKDLPESTPGRPPRDSALGEAKAWVVVEEIYRSIRPSLERAVACAHRLAAQQRIDRIVLTGQSSWIPLVRRLFTRSKSEGGFGLAPNKIEFDERNAKAAVSKGACLLRVMRDALVGFDVDVSDFKANLLSEIFYKSPVGGKRILFSAGPVDDLRYVEESPDPASFARHLSIFCGSPGKLLGQFDFGGPGDGVPDFSEHAKATVQALSLEGALPSHPELMRQRGDEGHAYAEIVGALRDWPERAIVSWIEASASSGSKERPLYRYYLTKNRNLLAVRDSGDGEKQLFTLHIDDRFPSGVGPTENPFSGAH